MTDQYTTPLSDLDIPGYERFVKVFTGSNEVTPQLLDQQTKDYDLQGFYKKYVAPIYAQGKIWSNTDSRNHLTDEFKKPNHPTFSIHSIYHNPSKGLVGGVWTELPNGSFSFTPSLTNQSYYPGSSLQEYFTKYEQGNTLNSVDPTIGFKYLRRR